MSEIGSLLRLLVQCDKEIKVTAVNVTDTATKFTSQLTTGYKRKILKAFNASDSGSGEIYWGALAVTASTGRPITKETEITIPFSTDVDVYFVADAGENGDLRVTEGA